MQHINRIGKPESLTMAFRQTIPVYYITAFAVHMSYGRMKPETTSTKTTKTV
jgi:hypothetical protein